MSTNKDHSPLNEEKLPSFPFAFVFDNYTDYDKGVLKKRSERVMFEYLIFASGYFLRHKGANTFWHSYQTIKVRTGLSQATARKIITSFGGHGCRDAPTLLKFLTTDSKVIRGAATTSFKINYKVLISHLEDVYGRKEILNVSQRFRLEKRRDALDELRKLKSSLS